MKIVTLSVAFPGAKRPLEEGAKLGLWEFILLQGEKINIPPADVYILAAWHPVYSQLLGLGKTGILWTSSAGEMDFEPIESQWLGEILTDPRISFVWFGDYSMGKAFPAKGFYAPYPLDTSLKLSKVKKQDIITLFCPAGPKKNIVNQLIAIRLAQKEAKLILHTNIQGYDTLLTLVDHVKHPWLPQEEYQELIASTKVNMAVSWAETFSYQVAEAALLGTASLTSLTIPVPGVIANNPNDPSDIAEGILDIAGDPYQMGKKFRDRTIQFASSRNEELEQTLHAHNLL